MLSTALAYDKPVTRSNIDHDPDAHEEDRDDEDGDAVGDGRALCG